MEGVKVHLWIEDDGRPLDLCASSNMLDPQLVFHSHIRLARYQGLVSTQTLNLRSWMVLYTDHCCGNFIFKKQRTAEIIITNTVKCYLWHLSRDHLCVARSARSLPPAWSYGTKGLMRQCQLLRNDRNCRPFHDEGPEAGTASPHVLEHERMDVTWWRWSWNLEATCLRELGGQGIPNVCTVWFF